MEQVDIQHVEFLRSQGKTYTEIAKILGISRNKLYYHINPKFRQQCKDYQKFRTSNLHPYETKLFSFVHRKYSSSTRKSPTTKSYRLLYLKVKRFNMGENNFTLKDVLDKFGETPQCYLTGEPINIYDTSSYHFDHIIPTSKGGENTLENLGICTSAANKMKGDLTPNQLLNLCRQMLEHHGYSVNK